MILLDDRLMVLPIEAEEFTPGGIVMPDVAKDKSQKGKVVAVGPGKFVPEAAAHYVDGRRPLAVFVGDVVLYGKFRGEEYKHDGVKHVILYEHDVIAILERAP